MRILNWFRKDLRLDDNTALSEAVRDATGDVVPFYASEPAILARADIAATRVRFALDALADLAAAVEAVGSRLALAHGDAVETVPGAALAAGADAVYWNDEYEPSLRARDDAVERALRDAGVRVKRFQDRLLVPPGTVRTKEGASYVLYTPSRRACEALPLSAPLPLVGRLARFVGGTGSAPGAGLAAYDSERDQLSAPATSQLSADLKFGTIGVRRVASAVLDAARERPALRAGAERFVVELRWRDFYAHVLDAFPHGEHGAFRRAFDAIEWSGSDAHFEAWAEGRTGVPVVDAGMRELTRTGRMHNRARMIVASFLTKDLLIDWRRGERHFMRTLVDGDLASNNGGWQWAAGTGTDAAPYFRIFNPVRQGRRFDAGGAYVRRWVPELAALPAAFVHRPWEAPPLALAEAGVTLGETYPFPIVEHAAQRERVLAAYAAARVTRR